MSPKLTAWLRLIRPPNLFSVPGDSLAGFLLAGGAGRDWLELTSICIASLSAYVFGLITNDIADLEEDRLERPYRPLPSGMIATSTAKVAALATALISLAFSMVTPCSLLVCTGLLSCIVLYNYYLRKIRFAGASAMAFCRVLNIALGASVIFSYEHSAISMILTAFYALGVFLYITGVTVAAKDETKTMEKRPGRALFMSGAVLAYLILFARVSMTHMYWYSIMTGILSSIAAAVFVILAYRIYKLFSEKSTAAETQTCIGLLIWNLILLQTAAIFACGWIWVGLAMCGGIYLAKLTARKFYGS